MGSAPDEPSLITENALVRLGEWLGTQAYAFITPSPATHARVLRRPMPASHASLRDAFGWSRPFAPALLPQQLLEELLSAGLLAQDATGCQSRVRFSSLDGMLLAHSAYPTVQEDAVFFGPDTYRFARLIGDEWSRASAQDTVRILDIGCGSGAGGLAAARRAGAAQVDLVLSDINPAALVCARANARLAGVDATALQSDLYADVTGEFDWILANPPYLLDADHRTYRDGGGPLGGELSARMLREGLARLAPGGRFVLYTGSVIADGHDAMRTAVASLAGVHGWPWTYEELDPDVFGEELDLPAYAGCDRIAAVGAVVRRPAP